MADIHTCSYHCDRPACILAQRDELRAKVEAAEARGRELAALLGEARDYVEAAASVEASMNKYLMAPRTTAAQFLARMDTAMQASREGR